MSLSLFSVIRVTLIFVFNSNTSFVSVLELNPPDSSLTVFQNSTPNMLLGDILSSAAGLGPNMSFISAANLPSSSMGINRLCLRLGWRQIRRPPGASSVWELLPIPSSPLAVTHFHSCQHPASGPPVSRPPDPDLESSKTYSPRPIGY